MPLLVRILNMVLIMAEVKFILFQSQQAKQTMRNKVVKKCYVVNITKSERFKKNNKICVF